MKVQAMTEIELMLVRPWILEIYHSGKAFASVSKSQLDELRKKLVEIDEEMLKRVLMEPLNSFVDENFDATLEQVKKGEI